MRISPEAVVKSLILSTLTFLSDFFLIQEDFRKKKPYFYDVSQNSFIISSQEIIENLCILYIRACKTIL